MRLYSGVLKRALSQTEHETLKRQFLLLLAISSFLRIFPASYLKKSKPSQVVAKKPLRKLQGR